MGYKIKEIALDDELFSRYEFISNSASELEKKKRLSNLSKINIFIGTNNSGKSRFLRYLFANQFSLLPSDFDLKTLDDIIADCKNQLAGIFEHNGVSEYGGINPTLSHYNPSGLIKPNDLFVKPFLAELTKLISIQPRANYAHIPGRDVSLNTEKFAQLLREIGNTTKEKLVAQLGNLSPELSYSFEKVYIPTLRGLRPFTTNEGEDQYQERTLQDYFKADNLKSNIITGLLINNTVRDKLVGNLQDRKLILGFQEFLSSTFFEKNPVALIPSIRHNRLKIKIGDEEEKEIHELGDGIQMLIILTFPLFINQGKNLLIFFEEPELFLHPGLQRIFIETLAKPLFENFQYFIATHSNHFLDLTLDVEQISVYTFKKIFKDEMGDEKPAHFHIENVSNEDTNVLDLIGVKNSSVFLSNCTIWIEGITDRYYLRKYLKVYQNSLLNSESRFREDTHYSFVEYSGGNITHWSFLDEDVTNDLHRTINVDRICSRIFLISDQDESKEKRHEKLREKLGEQYYCLECREVENLLSAAILKEVIAEYEGVEVSQLKFKLDLAEENYKHTLLGNYIDEILDNKKRRGSYALDSGTVSDKVNFCKRALDHIETINDLSEEARKLCEKIYTFIKRNNPK